MFSPRSSNFLPVSAFNAHVTDQVPRLQKHPHKMGFGRVTKYWRISLKDIKSTSFLHSIARAAQEAGETEHLVANNSSIEEGEDDTLVRAWDESIELASGKYRYENHNLLANNCHDHVSESLRRINFKGTTHWNTITLTIYLMLYGKFVRYEAHFSISNQIPPTLASN